MRSLTSLCAALVCGLAATADAASPPAPTGPYYISFTQHVFEKITPNDPLAGTGTSLVMTYYYPTLQPPNGTTPYLDRVTAGLYETAFNATAGSWAGLTAPMTFQAPPLNASTGKPTVFFSPGGGRNAALYSILLGDLVSHGYVVAAVDHPYEAPHLQFPYGGPSIYGLPVRFSFGAELATRVYASFRVPDIIFAMQTFSALARQFGAPFNLTHFTVMGSSLGGAVAAEAVKATVTDGENGDISILGGVNLDGTLWGKPAAGGPEADVGRPFLQFASEGHSGLSDKSWANFSDAQTGYFREIWVAGSLHFDMSDLTYLKEVGGPATESLGGVINGSRMVEIIRRYVKAFFDAASGLPVAEGDEGLLEEEKAEFPEVKIRTKKG